MTHFERLASINYAQEIAFSIALRDWRTAGAQYRQAMRDTDVPEDIKDILEAMIDGFQDWIDVHNSLTTPIIRK